MSKKLAIYFSASGISRALATLLSQETGASLVEIKPKTPYTEEDLNWHNKNSTVTSFYLVCWWLRILHNRINNIKFVV